MIKNLVAVTAVSASLMGGSAFAATNFTTSFTSDNFVNSFSYAVNGVSNAVSLSGIANLNNWTKSSALNLSIASGSAYDFVWSVSNQGKASASNPAGFLAQFNLGGTDYFSSNAPMWTVSKNGGKTWTAATLANVVSPFNGGSNIWTNANGGPIAGISTSAQWIWDGVNNVASTPKDILVKATVVSAVPEASMLAMMGLGLLAMFGFARSRKQA
ncbi:MAG: PEP-CTERM sorting domain-containing protein [Thiotrichales bacterium]|jgi:hypothetical protein|nr:PEP-CTERM sorting domain-containing protein [Thiotrichales bacterium]